MEEGCEGKDVRGRDVRMRKRCNVCTEHAAISFRAPARFGKSAKDTSARSRMMRRERDWRSDRQVWMEGGRKEGWGREGKGGGREGEEQEGGIRVSS